MTHSRLHELNRLGQSAWYDNMRRGLLVSGEMKQLVDLGVTGITSNPTIFEKAVAGSSDYDESLRAAVERGVTDPVTLFEDLALDDIRTAADLLRGVYKRTRAHDGYVSLEVSPDLAHDAEGTIAEARRLFARLNRPNVMIKVPATPAGMQAIETLIGEGININVTLIFSLEAYRQVIEAYIRGLETRLARGGALDKIASVASFFVSRIDTVVDKRLEARAATQTDDEGRARVEALYGLAAIANARLAYALFREMFHTSRFAHLRQSGAQVQRPLWASTSTKNPRYPDTYYVDALIGPDTVDTLPPQTIVAFNEHGTASMTIGEHMDAAQALFGRLAAEGITMESVTQQTLDEGVDAFAASFHSLHQTLAERVAVFAAARKERESATLGRYAKRVAARVAALDELKAGARLWAREPALWKGDDAEAARSISTRLGWLDSPALMLTKVGEITAVADAVRAAGYTHAVLCGMGGSSLAPDVLRATFGVAKKALNLTVLDTTHPDAVRAALARSAPARTLYIISSKSGSTIEVDSFYRFFREHALAALGEHVGEHFIAITDPGTPLEALADQEGFRHVFINPPDIGGRYSVLSFFGLVPAALLGIDLTKFLQRAERMRRACAATVPAERNPGLWLGAIVGELAAAGRDKLTFLLSPSIATFGYWVEQLVAESLGKEGRGALPIEGEPRGQVKAYGNDRVFAYLRVDGDDNRALDTQARTLAEAGHPVVRLLLQDRYDMGEEFFRWEFATAAAGVVLGVNPFDEPNVTESKRNTARFLELAAAIGGLPPVEQVIGPVFDAAAVNTLAALFKRTRARDYLALMAYAAPAATVDALLTRVRGRIRDARGVPVTVGYGPRFLHSTGQFHKGGPDNGVFIQLMADAPQDLAIPGVAYSFGTLIGAQARGDLQALRERGRRTVAVALGADVMAGLAAFDAAVVRALRLVAAQVPAAKKGVAKKGAAKKAVAKKGAAKKAVAKKSAVKKAAVKKVAAKKPAAKKGTTKKTAVKQRAPKPPAVKKPAVKKGAVKRPAGKRKP